MRSPRIITLGSLFVIAVTLGACSGGATATPPPATPAPTQAATAAPQATPASGGASVEAKTVGTVGTVLVAGSNGMTVYNFSKDVANSGASACSGGCLTTWPALTVPAGAAPVAGDGVTGKLGTITRADDGTLQVTYNGLPLYFFTNDKAPGDANGVYQNWVVVKP